MGNADTHRDLHDLFNTRDFDGVAKRVADGFRYTDRPRGLVIEGGDGFKAWMGEWTAAMSNARVSDARYLDCGDTSVALFTGRGTHDGQFGPLPASGKELSFSLCEVLTYDADGSVTGGEIYYDQASIAAQIGAGTATVVRPAGESRAIWMLGGLYEVLLSGEESGGAATIMQMTIPAGFGPPPHTHPGGEAVYVAEGTVRYHIGGDTVEGGPGSFFYVPAGTVEHFEPTSDVRVIVTYMPGGIDRFFAEAGEPAARREVPPAPTSPPDVERLAAIGARYGMQILAPEA